jgi:hypothetical protein
LTLASTRPARDPWHIDWLSIAGVDDQPTNVVPARSLAFRPISLFEQDDAQPLHAAAIEHSDAYQTRAKIHKYSSFATLPLFAVEIALGQSLYNNTPGVKPGGNRTVHAFVGARIVGLFGLNTVAGTWNLFGDGATRAGARCDWCTGC